MQHIEQVVASSQENSAVSNQVKSSISDTSSVLDRLMNSSSSLSEAVGGLCKRD
jgi:methyl-accepting chemotaxis protein